MPEIVRTDNVHSDNLSRLLAIRNDLHKKLHVTTDPEEKRIIVGQLNDINDQIEMAYMAFTPSGELKSDPEEDKSNGYVR